MFIAALVIIAKKYSNPTYINNEWIHKMWHIVQQNTNSAIKGNEVLTHATTQRNLSAKWKT